jgi:uncharacterized phage protein (TIGR01671 family)
MNREIKFRAWHTNLEKMFSPEEMGEDQLTLMPNGQGFINVHGADTRRSELMRAMIPLQYTGLKDKNGKEIYEGDVVKGIWYGKTIDKDIFGVVDFEEGMFGLTNKIDDEPYSINRLFVEVIGNIYENPELLSK